MDLTVVTSPHNDAAFRNAVGDDCAIICSGIRHTAVRVIWEQTFLPYKHRDADVLLSRQLGTGLRCSSKGL